MRLRKSSVCRAAASSAGGKVLPGTCPTRRQDAGRSAVGTEAIPSHAVRNGALDGLGILSLMREPLSVKPCRTFFIQVCSEQQDLIRAGRPLRRRSSAALRPLGSSLGGDVLAARRLHDQERENRSEDKARKEAGKRGRSSFPQDVAGFQYSPCFYGFIPFSILRTLVRSHEYLSAPPSRLSVTFFPSHSE